MSVLGPIGSFVDWFTKPTRDAVRDLVGNFVTAMDFGVEHVVRRPYGFAAKHGADPLAGVPLPRRGTERAAARGEEPASPWAQLFGVDRRTLEGRVGKARAEEISRMSSSDAYKASFEGHPIARFAHEMTFDPLNLLTAGSAGVAKVPGAASSRVGSAIIKTDDIANRVQGAPIHGALKGGEAVLRRTGLLDPSRRGILNKRVHDLQRGIEQQARHRESMRLSAAPLLPHDQLTAQAPLPGMPTPARQLDLPGIEPPLGATYQQRAFDGMGPIPPPSDAPLPFVPAPGQRPLPGLDVVPGQRSFFPEPPPARGPLPPPPPGVDGGPVRQTGLPGFPSPPAVQAQEAAASAGTRRVRTSTEATEAIKQFQEQAAPAPARAARTAQSTVPPSGEQAMREALGEAPPASPVEQAALEMVETTPQPSPPTPDPTPPVRSLEDQLRYERVEGVLKKANLTETQRRIAVDDQVAHLEHKRSGAMAKLERGEEINPYDLPEPHEYFHDYDEMVESIRVYTEAGLDPAMDPRWDYVYPSMQAEMGIHTGRPNKLAKTTRSLIESRDFGEDMMDWLRKEGLVGEAKEIKPIDEVLRGSKLPGDDSLGIVHPSVRRLWDAFDDFMNPKVAAPPPIVNPDDVMDIRAREAYETAMSLPAVESTLKSADRAEKMLRHLQEKYKIRTTDPDEFIAAVRAVEPKIAGRVEKYVLRWGIPGTPEAASRRNREILVAARDAWAKELGVSEPGNVFSKNYEWMLSALRGLNLLSVRQIVQNFSDELVKAGIEGIPPEVLLRQFHARIARNNGPVEEALRLVGINEIPTDWSGELLRRLPRDTTSGIAEEFLSQSALHRFRALKPLAKADDIRRDLDVGQQMVFRQVAGLIGFQKGLKERMPRFISEAQELAGTHGEALGKALRELDPMTSPDEIARIVREVTGNEQLAMQLHTRWHRTLNEAINDGTALANRVHFDYTDIRNIDEKVRHFSMFHFWASRNLPYYAATLANNPWMLRGLLKYNQISKDEQEAMGAPHRMFGKLIRVPLPTMLATAMFGDEMTLAFDPMILLSIYDQTRERVQDDETMPALGRLQNFVGRFGFGLMPWFDTFLNIAGAHGDDEPRGWLRHGGIIQAITGVDVEYPFREAIGGIRRSMDLPWSDAPERAVSSSLIRDFQINKKLREMALNETGNPHDPRYTIAMTDPSDPLYKEASRRVRNEAVIREFWGLMSNVPMTQMSGTEQMVRREGIPYSDRQLDAATMQQLYNEQHPAITYWGMPQGRREAQIRSAQAAFDHFGRLQARNPEFVQLLSTLYPEWSNYRSWQAGQPEGSNVSVDAYLGRLIDPQEAQRLISDLLAAGITPEEIQGYLLQQGRSTVNDLNRRQAQLMRRHLLGQ